MIKKSFYVASLALLAIQVGVPQFNASESTQTIVTSQSTGYATEHPTKAQVKAAQPTDIVVFEDNVVAESVSNVLGIQVGNVTVEDMTRVTDLVFLTPVASLSGLEYAVNLRSIEAIIGNISDLTPLANLTKMEDLDLRANKITDISALASLTKLVNLNISYNQVSDISAIKDATGLKSLYVEENNISDISALTNLTQLDDVEMPFNKITDITPLSNATALRRLGLGYNEISDISALSNMSNLEMLSLPVNKISDFSPIQANAKLNADLKGQTVILPPKTVYTAEPVIFNVNGENGKQYPVNMGVPNEVVTRLTGSTTINFNSPYKMQYSASFAQFVTHLDKTWKDEESINEGKALSDDELKTLFNVVDMGEPYTVDQSAIDYHTPGTYQVTFETAADTINTSLVIVDVKPVITVSNSTVQIKLGETIADYLESFGITATEIIDGDLTHRIIFDDSKVDYNSVGSYQVDFKIIDDEGNEANVAGNVTIEDAPIVTPEVEKSEIEIEEKTTVSDTKSEIEEQTTKSEADTIAMTTDKQTLASTGNKTSVLIIALSLITTGLFAQKRKTIK